MNPLKKNLSKNQLRYFKSAIFEYGRIYEERNVLVNISRKKKLGRAGYRKYN